MDCYLQLRHGRFVGVVGKLTASPPTAQEQPQQMSATRVLAVCAHHSAVPALDVAPEDARHTQHRRGVLDDVLGHAIIGGLVEGVVVI